MGNTNLIHYRYEQKAGIEEVRLYVSKRYQRFLDYAKYHSSLAGLESEANDILNEVMASLFSKDFNYLVRLYTTKRNTYYELDFFILHMIKLNCHSHTSPYQSKYKRIPADPRVNYERLNLIDEQDEEIDKAAITLKQFRLVRFVFERLDLTDFERKVFEHGFIMGLTIISLCTGTQSKNVVYATFKCVLTAIHEILYNQGLTSLKPKKTEMQTRKNELVTRFMQTRKIIIKHSEN